MDNINKIRSEGSSFPVDPVVQNLADENPFVRTTEKMSQLGRQIASPKKEGGLAKRTIVPLADSDDLAARVLSLTTHWDELSPDEQLDALFDLKDRIEVLQLEDSPQAQKVAAQVKHLYFQHASPIIQELDLSREGENAPLNFAQEIHRLADTILTHNSLAPFYQLNDIQQKEIYRIALRRSE